VISSPVVKEADNNAIIVDARRLGKHRGRGIDNGDIAYGVSQETVVHAASIDILTCDHTVAVDGCAAGRDRSRYVETCDRAEVRQKAVVAGAVSITPGDGPVRLDGKNYCFRGTRGIERRELAVGVPDEAVDHIAGVLVISNDHALRVDAAWVGEIVRTGDVKCGERPIRGSEEAVPVEERF